MARLILEKHIKPAVLAATLYRRGCMKGLTMNQIPVLNFQEYISADGDTLLTDSRKVAFVFGKQHKDVLKAIRARLEDAGEWGELETLQQQLQPQLPFTLQ